jgi:O-antigen/teichoic acid export membrane protein
MTGARVLLVAASIIAVVHVLPSTKAPAFSWCVLRQCVSYGGWVTLGNAINPILLYSERFMLGSLVSIAAVGFYTAPFEAVTKLWIIPISVAGVIFPACSALGASRRSGALEVLYGRTFRYIFALLASVVAILAVYAHGLIKLWLGAAYADQSSLIMQILAIGVFLNCFSHLPYNFLLALGRPELPAKLFFAEVPFYLIFAYYFIRQFGAAGAALAWSARVTLEAIVLYVLLWRALRIKLNRHELSRIALATGTFLLLLAALTVSSHASMAGWQKICIGVFSIALFNAFFWYHILDERDRFTALAILFPIASNRTETTTTLQQADPNLRNPENNQLAQLGS